MPAIIRIKRSGDLLTPASLKVGELAYSYADASKQLYIGIGPAINSLGDASSIAVIGGERFTEILNSTPGIASAGMAAVLGPDRNLDYLKLDTAEITNASIDSAYIRFLDADSAVINNLMSDSAHITYLGADSAYIHNISVDSAYIQYADIDSAHIDNVSIDSAYIRYADVDSAHIDNVSIDSAYVKFMDLDSGHIDNVTIDSAYVKYADIDSAHVDNLDVDSAHIDYATIDYANIDSADIGQVDIDSAYISRADIDSANIGQLTSDSAEITYATIHTSYQPLITGPSTITIDPSGIGDNTGKVLIKGDLQVDGDQTIVNSTVVSTNDINILIADSAINDAAADGAGITVYGEPSAGIHGRASLYWDAAENKWRTSVGIITPTIDADSGRIGKLSGSHVIYDSGIISQFMSDSAFITQNDGVILNYNIGYIDKTFVDSMFWNFADEHRLIFTDNNNRLVQDSGLIYGTNVSANYGTDVGLQIGKKIVVGNAGAGGEGFAADADSGWYNTRITNDGTLTTNNLFAETLKIGDSSLGRNYSGTDRGVTTPHTFYGIETTLDSFTSTLQNNTFKSDISKDSAIESRIAGEDISLVTIRSNVDSSLLELRKDGSLNITGDLYKDGEKYTAGGIFDKTPFGPAGDIADVQYVPDPTKVHSPTGIGSRVAIGKSNPKFDIDATGKTFSFSAQIATTALNPTPSGPIVYPLQPTAQNAALAALGWPVVSDDSDKSRLLFDTTQARFRAGYFDFTDIAGNEPTAFGAFSAAFGKNTRASIFSFAAGDTSRAYSPHSFSVGKTNRVGTFQSNAGAYSIAIGKENEVIDFQGAGNYAAYHWEPTYNSTNPTTGIAIGELNVVNADIGIAIGKLNLADSNNSIAIGSNNSVAELSIGIGNYNIVGGSASIAIGGEAGTPNVVSGNASYVMGKGHNVGANLSFAFGSGSTITAGNTNSFAFGKNLDIRGDNSVGFNLGVGTGAKTWVPTTADNFMSIQEGSVTIGSDSDLVEAGISVGVGNLLVKGDLIYEGSFFKRGPNGVENTNPWVDDGIHTTYSEPNKNLGVYTATPNHVLEITGDILVRGNYSSNYKNLVDHFDSAQGTSSFAQYRSAGGVNAAPSLFTYYPEGGILRAGQIIASEHSNDSMGAHSIGIGYKNKVIGDYSTVLGGNAGHAAGDYSTVLGGVTSRADGNYSTVLGGNGSSVSGNYSMVANAFSTSKVDSLGSYSTVIGAYDGNIYGTKSIIIGGQSVNIGGAGQGSQPSYSMILNSYNSQIDSTSDYSSMISAYSGSRIKSQRNTIIGGAAAVTLEANYAAAFNVQGSTTISGSYATALNASGTIEGSRAIAIGGTSHTISGSRSISIGGNNTKILGANNVSIAMGTGSNHIKGSYSVFIGEGNKDSDRSIFNGTTGTRYGNFFIGRDNVVDSDANNVQNTYVIGKDNRITTTLSKPVFLIGQNTELTNPPGGHANQIVLSNPTNSNLVGESNNTKVAIGRSYARGALDVSGGTIHFGHKSGVTFPGTGETGTPLTVPGDSYDATIYVNDIELRDYIFGIEPVDIEIVPDPVALPLSTVISIEQSNPAVVVVQNTNGLLTVGKTIQFDLPSLSTIGQFLNDSIYTISAIGPQGDSFSLRDITDTTNVSTLKGTSRSKLSAGVITLNNTGDPATDNYDPSFWGAVSGTSIPFGAYLKLQPIPIVSVAPSKFANSVIIDSDLIVKGTTTLGDSLSVAKDVIINGNYLDVTSGYIKGGNYLDIASYGKFGDSITAGGDLTIAGSITGATFGEFGDSITAGGDLTIAGSLTGATFGQFSDSITAGGDLTIAGSLTGATFGEFSDSVNIGGDVSATGKGFFGDSVYITGKLTVAGSVHWLDDTDNDSFYIGYNALGQPMSLDSFVVRPGSAIYNAVFDMFDTDYVQQRVDSENNWRVLPDALVYNPNDEPKAVAIGLSNDQAWTGQHKTMADGATNVGTFQTTAYQQSTSFNKGNLSGGTGDSIGLDVQGRLNVRTNPFNMNKAMYKNGVYNGGTPPIMANGEGWPSKSWMIQENYLDQTHIRAQFDSALYKSYIDSAYILTAADSAWIQHVLVPNTPYDDTNWIKQDGGGGITAAWIQSQIDSAFVISVWDSDYYWKHDSFNAVYIGAPHPVTGNDEANSFRYDGKLKIAINKTGGEATHNLDVLGSGNFDSDLEAKGDVYFENMLSVGSYSGLDNIGANENKIIGTKGLYVGDSTHLRGGLLVLGHDNILDSEYTFTFDSSYLNLRQAKTLNTVELQTQIGNPDAGADEQHVAFLFNDSVDDRYTRIVRVDVNGDSSVLVSGVHYDSLGNTALFDSAIYGIGGIYNSLKTHINYPKTVYVLETALATNDISATANSRWMYPDTTSTRNTIILASKKYDDAGVLQDKDSNLIDDNGDSLDINAGISLHGVNDPIVKLLDSLGNFKGQLTNDNNRDFKIVNNQYIEIYDDLRLSSEPFPGGNSAAVSDSLGTILLGDKFIIQDYSVKLTSETNIFGPTNLYGEVVLGSAAMATAAKPGYPHIGSRFTTHDSFIVKGGMRFESNATGKLEFFQDVHVDSQSTWFFGPAKTITNSTIIPAVLADKEESDGSGNLSGRVESDGGPNLTNGFVQGTPTGVIHLRTEKDGYGHYSNIIASSTIDSSYNVAKGMDSHIIDNLAAAANTTIKQLTMDPNGVMYYGAYANTSSSVFKQDSDGIGNLLSKIESDGTFDGTLGPWYDPTNADPVIAARNSDSAGNPRRKILTTVTSKQATLDSYVVRVLESLPLNEIPTLTLSLPVTINDSVYNRTLTVEDSIDAGGNITVGGKSFFKDDVDVDSQSSVFISNPMYYFKHESDGTGAGIKTVFPPNTYNQYHSTLKHVRAQRFFEPGLNYQTFFTTEGDAQNVMYKIESDGSPIFGSKAYTTPTGNLHHVLNADGTRKSIRVGIDSHIARIVDSDYIGIRLETPWNIEQTGSQKKIYYDEEGAVIIGPKNTLLTTDNTTRFLVDSGNAVFLSSILEADENNPIRGTIPNYNSASSMMWFATRGALRIGALDYPTSADFWKDSNVGYKSIAIGSNTRAGHHSVALGNDTKAGVTFQDGVAGSVDRTHAVSLGQTIINENFGGVAIGQGITNTDVNTAYKFTTNHIVSIGQTIFSYGASNLSIGDTINTPTANLANNITSIGKGLTTLTTSADNSILIGKDISISKTALAIGYTINTTNALNSTIMGHTVTTNNASNSIVMGRTLTIDAAANSVFIGSGTGTTQRGTEVVSIGRNNITETTNARRSVVVGTAAKSIKSDAVAVGNNAVVEAAHAVAVGKDVTVQSRGSHGVVIGRNSKINSHYGSSIGYDVEVTGSSNGSGIGRQIYASGGGTAIGNSLYASAGGLAIGQNVSARGANGLALGRSVRSGNSGVVIGEGSLDNGTNAVSIGKGNSANSNNGVAIGRSNKTTNTSGVAIGMNNLASGNTSFASGHGSIASATQSTAIGYRTNATGTNAVSIGRSNSVGTNSTGVGSSNTVGTNYVVIGHGNSTSSSGNYEYTVGAFNTGNIDTNVVGRSNTGNNQSEIFGNSNTGNYRVTIFGHSNTASTTSTNNKLESMVYGRANTVAGYNGIAFGSSNTVSYSGQAFGKSNTADGGIAFGHNNTTSTSNSFSSAFGRLNNAATDGIAFGRSNTVTNNAIAFGRDNVAANNAIVIGRNISADGLNTISLGHNVTTTVDATNSVSIGLGSTPVTSSTPDTLSIQGGTVIIGQNIVNTVPASATLNSSTKSVTTSNGIWTSDDFGLEVTGNINVAGDVGGRNNQFFVQGMRLYDYIRRIASDSDHIKYIADSDYIYSAVTKEYLRQTQTDDMFFQNDNSGPTGDLLYNGQGAVGIGLDKSTFDNTPGYLRYPPDGFNYKPNIPYKLDVKGNVNLDGLTYQGDVILPTGGLDSNIYLNHYTNEYILSISEESATLWFDSAYINERGYFGGNPNNTYDSSAVFDLITTDYINDRIDVQRWPSFAQLQERIDSAIDPSMIAFRVNGPSPKFGTDYDVTPTGWTQFTNPSAFEALYNTKVGIGKSPYDVTFTNGNTVVQGTEMIDYLGKTTPGAPNAGLGIGGKVVISGPQDPAGFVEQAALEIWNGHIEINGQKLQITNVFEEGSTYTVYDNTKFVGIGKTTPAFELDVAGKINADDGVFVNSVNIVDLLDSDYVKTVATSDYIKSIADSAYIHSAADSDHISTIVNEIYLKEIIDSAYVKTIADNEYIKSIADSAYILGTDLKSVIDSAYILSTDLKSVIDSAYILSAADSGYILSVADSAYVLGTDLKSVIDSAYILSVADSAYVKTVTDSAYILSIADSAHILSAADSGYIQSVLNSAHNVIPAAHEIYDLGSPTRAWRDLHLSGNTINLGGISLSSSPTGISIADENGNASKVIGIDSNAASNMIDSAYVQSRANSTWIKSVADSAYILSADLKSVIDSAYITSISNIFVDSAYVQSRQEAASAADIAAVVTTAYINTAVGIGTSDIDFGANKIAYSNNYATIASMPSPSTYEGMFAYQAGKPKVAQGGSWNVLPTEDFVRTIADSAVNGLVGAAPDALNTLVELASALGNDSNFSTTITNSIADKLPLSGGTLTGDLDLGTNKVLYSNVYSTEGDLPSASTYHGMFAHVHSTGKGYFAHAGSWVQLANASDIGTDSAAVTGIIDSAYINARVVIPAAFDSADASFVAGNLIDSAYVNARVVIPAAFDSADASFVAGNLVDSAYIQARVSAGTDSAAIVNLIDSAYIASRVTVSDEIVANTVDSAYIQERVSTTTGFDIYKYTATQNQTVFTGNDENGVALEFMATNNSPLVYINGALLRFNDDYTRTGTNTVTLNTAADSTDEVTIMGFRNASGSVVYNTTTQVAYTKPKFANYKFEADSGSTVFTGTDVNGINASFDSDKIQVFNNGIRLVLGADYTVTATNTITTTYGLDSGDEIIINAIVHGTELYDASILDSADIIEIAGGASGGGLTVSDTAPAAPVEGQMWFDPEALETYVYYTDDNATSQWVKANPSGASSVVSLIDSAYINARVVIPAAFDSADVVGIVDSAYISARTSAPNSWSEVTSTVTATAGQRLILDTSTAIVVNLPVAATLGDEIRIIDGTGNASTNNITINRNGHKIEASDSDLTIDVDRAAFGLVYYNTANGWLFTEK